MNNETLNINKENVLNAYGTATDEQKAMLEIIFGKDTFKPKDIMDRIKTFEDACDELGRNHHLVLAYQNANFANEEIIGKNKDIIAYLKLRIIVAALNEGWTPQFVPGEYRWFPYFVLYTQEEIDEMNEETRARVVYRSNSYADANGGVSYASSYYDAAIVNANIGSRLANN